MGVISEEFFPTPYSVVMKMIEPYGYNLNKRSVLEPSAGDGDSSWHESKFFRVRCYKKGTAHIEFKDEKLWARFNTAVNEGKLILGF